MKKHFLILIVWVMSGCVNDRIIIQENEKPIVKVISDFTKLVGHYDSNGEYHSMYRVQYLYIRDDTSGFGKTLYNLWLKDTTNVTIKVLLLPEEEYNKISDNYLITSNTKIK
jgi:hypothetical protein